MSKVLVASWPGFFGSVAMLRLLVTRREVRTVQQTSATRAAEVSTKVTLRDIQPSPDASLIAADRRHHHVRSLDAVAGSEFVDDRIRRRE